MTLVISPVLCSRTPLCSQRPQAAPSGFGDRSSKGAPVQTSYQKGLQAEHRAREFFRARGYRILAQRLRTPVGEIDLIAEKKGAVVCVEVKARPGFSQAAWAITPRQLTRITQASEFFLAQSHVSLPKTLQIDALFVLPDGEIIHHQNISL